jgi:hypothetical protein
MAHLAELPSALSACRIGPKYPPLSFLASWGAATSRTQSAHGHRSAELQNHDTPLIKKASSVGLDSEFWLGGTFSSTRCFLQGAIKTPGVRGCQIVWLMIGCCLRHHVTDSEL